ncbi:MAG: hypothetical protein ACR2MK_03200 [Solirubrobacteraceae bacterium]
MKTRRRQALTRITDHRNTSHPPDAVDELARELLESGGVLSQIISHMIESEAAGRSASDAAPIPTVAHELIRDTLAGLKDCHSASDIRAAAIIVGEATDAICENIFFVPPEGMTEGGHVA